MSFEVNGKLHKAFPTEKKSESFQTRDFVIEIDNGNYPQLIKFQVVQDRCSMVDDYQEGEMVKVYFDLRGREWNGKYLTNLNAWRMEKIQTEASPAATSAPSPQAGFPSADDMPPAFDDDLPF